MNATTPLRFVAILSPTRSGYSASLPDVPGCVAAGKDYALTAQAIRESLALHLLALTEDGEPLPKALTQEVTDLQPAERLEWIEPAPLNPVSIAVGELIRGTGQSLRTLAHDVGMNYAALSRMQDPFYWGHSLSSLRRLAEALGRGVQVEFTAA